MTISSPTVLDTTLFQDGQAAGSITPSDIRQLVDSVSGRASTTQTVSYTTVLADYGTRIRMNAAAQVLVTIPPNSSVAYDIGAVIAITQVGAGPVTIIAGAGVTVTAPTGFLPMTVGQNAEIYVRKDATDAWMMAGQLMPAPAHLSVPPGYPAANLTFEDQFLTTTVDSTKWLTNMVDQNGSWTDSGNLTLPESGPNAGGFQANYYSPTQVTVGWPGLRIQAVLDSAHSGLGYTWKSGVLCTHGKFTFNGGFAQARVKIPDVTSGMWPAFWHMEGTAEVDTFEGGFLVPSHNLNQIISNGDHLTSVQQVLTDVGVDLSADYHILAVEYVPGVCLRFFLDSRITAVFTANIPTGGMSLILNMDVAASGASSFHSQVVGGTPSPSNYYISDVQVYSLPTTNLIRNPVNAGTPVIGTPGTLPTNWSYVQGSDALTTQVVSFGWVPEPYTGQMLPYIDIRISGTPAASTAFQIVVDNAAPIGVVSAILSAYTALIAGSLSHVGTLGLSADALTSGGGYISTPISGAYTLTSILTRSVVSGTMPGTTAKAQVYLALGITSGQAVDVTLKIAGLQLEVASTVNTWMP